MPAARAPRTYLFVCGIRTSTTDRAGWHFRAEEWVERYGERGDVADTFHYYMPGVMPWRIRAGVVDDLASCWYGRQQDPERVMVPVGHSNGAALVCAALLEHPKLGARHLHLIGSAAKRSFDKNGLNAALIDGRVDRVSIHWNKGDDVLRCWPRLLPLHGYGDQGLVNPLTYGDVDPRVREQVQSIQRAPGLGHMGYFDGRDRHHLVTPFARTMHDVMAP